MATRVVCTPGGKEATLIALQKKTGDVIWKCAVPQGDDAAYASIVIAKVDGSKQYVQMLQHQLVGVDAKSGKLLWHYNKAAGNMANIPTPVSSEGYVYGASGGRGGGGGGLVKLATSGDDAEAEQVYYSTKLPTAIGGSVKVGDHLYGTNNSVLICADFVTGDIKWTERSIAPASLMFADGMLYLHGENGDVALVEATPGGLPRKGQIHATRSAGSRQHEQGMGLSRRRQRPPIHPRRQHALVLRREGALNASELMLKRRDPEGAEDATTNHTNCTNGISFRRPHLMANALVEFSAFSVFSAFHIRFDKAASNHDAHSFRMRHLQSFF